MNNIKRLFILFILFAISNIQVTATGLLSSKYSLDDLKMILQESNSIGIPKINDRASWEKANQSILKSNYNEAMSLINYVWAPIPATTTLMFVRNGNRDMYESISFEKRKALFTFLLAEIYENKGRFMDQILNGVWSICEESYWGVPAHLSQGHGGAGLPDVNDHYVDLFNAETGCILALLDYIIGDKLDQISKHIRPRIANEINKRIFIPAMSWEHPWMHGKGRNGKRPNNWNPWICSNWLCAALLIEKDHDRKSEMVYKILNILDNFLTPYPEDGGCDEGPAYWSAASASLFDNIELLNRATNNSFAYVYNNEKVRNMGRFIYRAQISEEYFINFADASPKVIPNGFLVWRIGHNINDHNMMSMGAFYRNNIHAENRFQKYRVFFELFSYKEYSSTVPSMPLPENVWLPNIQVLVTRDKAATTEGYFMAVKGGHNAESHNHNDIGNFIVYYDGLPLIIDVGNGVYTAKTFSQKRYEIWSNSSDYHNCPTINGYVQQPGINFNANYIDHKIEKRKSSLKLDISKAYPIEANINYWYRTVTLNKEKCVNIEDQYALKHISEVKNSIMTCWPVEILSKGKLLIKFQSKQGKILPFLIRYNPSIWNVSVEKMEMNNPEDEGIKANWSSHNINRICFASRKLKEKGEYSFSIQRAM